MHGPAAGTLKQRDAWVAEFCMLTDKSPKELVPKQLQENPKLFFEMVAELRDAKDLGAIASRISVEVAKAKAPAASSTASQTLRAKVRHHEHACQLAA